MVRRVQPPLRALAVLAVLALAPPAAAATVEAGSLGAGPGGRPVLTQAPGSLGFRTAAGSFHATRVLDSRRRRDAWTSTFATDDPAGRRLVVRLAPDGDGVMAVSIRRSGRGRRRWRPRASGSAPARGERYLGFGERSNRVDQRGGEVESYVAEGPYEEDERAMIPAFVPAWGYHPRPDATYYPVPWLLSTAGYGVLVDDPETSYFRLDQGGSGVWSVEVRAPSLNLRVFAGPRPADVLRRFTGASAASPPVPAPFLFGPWYQPTGADRRGCSSGCGTRDVPLSVAQTYTHYLPCADQAGREEAERARVAGFHDAGLAVTTYFNPMICTTHPALRRGGGRRRAREEPGGRALRVPLQHPRELRRVAVRLHGAAAGRDLYGRLLREAVADGHDGWMEDFGEYTPLDAVAADGSSGRRCTTPIPASTTAARSPAWPARRAGSRASCARAGPAAPAARRWCGAATPPWTGASTACARWSPTG